MEFDGISLGVLIVAIILTLALWILWECFLVWLWGVIMVGIFSLPSLGFWQLFGLQILLGSLFKGSGIGATITEVMNKK